MKIRVGFGGAAVATLLFQISTAIADAPPAIDTRLLTADVKVAPNGTATEMMHVEVQLNNDAAVVRSGQTSIPFDASLQKVEITDSYTLKPDGSKIVVNPSAIREQLLPGVTQLPLYSDMRVKIIIFPQVSIGDVIAYTARITTIKPAIPGQFQFLDAFPTTTGFKQVRETVTAPVSLPLQVENHGVVFSKRVQGKSIIYGWQYSAPRTTQPIVSELSIFERTPRVILSSFRDYGQLGRTYAAMAAPGEVITPKITALANKITQGVSDRREQARRMYEWVSRNIRYVALELGRGAIVPHPAEMVLANGYGDCKDHVVLLGALLKAKGITSEAVLINGTNSYSLTKVASLAELNHVITWLPEFKLYLDSTGMIVPFGFLPPQEYGKPVVYASAGHVGLGTTPAMPGGIASVETRTVSRLAKDGKLSGITTTTAKGPYSVLLRAIALGIEAIGPEAAATQQLASLGYSSATGALKPDALTELGPNYAIKGTFQASGDKMLDGTSFFLPGGLRVLPVSGDGPMGPLFPGRLSPDETVPCYSVHASEDLSLEIPRGRQFSNVPKDTVIRSENIEFTARWALVGRTLDVHRDFKSRAATALCSGEIRRKNATALKKIADNYATQISINSEPSSASDNASVVDQGAQETFNSALVAAREQDYGQASKLFSRVLAMKISPDQRYSVYVDRALIYLEEGQIVLANRDIASAIATRPQRPQAYMMRGTIEQRMNRNDAALADYSAAIRTAPEMVQPRERRGMLEFQLHKYEAAAADLTVVLRANPANTGLMESRGIAYEMTGHYDQAAADFRQVSQSGSSNPLLPDYLCDALARSSKPATAIANCTSAIGQDPYSAIPFAGRGYAHYRLGQYRDALADFDAAVKKSPNRAHYLYARAMAEVSVGKAREGKLDMQRAEQLSPGIEKSWKETSISP